MSDNLWTYSDTTWTETGDLVGYDVEATDGSIGKVDRISKEQGSSYVVVDTGFWIFGKKRLIPAGAISRVSHDDEKVWVGMTKDQVKDAPDYQEDTWDEDARGSHTDYYGSYEWGV